jgi:uncharacterized protein YaaR (DUF327 family)
MTEREAQKVLDLNEIYESTDVKKAYYRLALRYHPDKNKTEEAKQKFQEICQAYEILQKEEKQENITDYFELLRTFLQYFIDESIVSIVMNKLANVCEKKGMDLLKRLQPSVLKKILEIIKKFEEVLHFSNEFKEEVEKINNDERWIIHPSLEDLFGEKVFRLVIKDNTYWVPVWHHHLVFDGPEGDIYVECFPILLGKEDEVSIDEYNHLHVKIVKTREEIWETENIQFQLGGKTFSVPRDKLVIKEHQVYRIPKEGIPLIQFRDRMYDVSHRGDVFVYITIINGVE